jgi:hypothetical protein
MLRILGLDADAGKNYAEIIEWGKRMTLTGICSEGAIYLAGRKTWVSDTFHVFERFVSAGNQMPDGTLADRNYVWLSEWQLNNINQNHLLPIDLEAYKKLRHHISKALVPLLQIWLFASVEGGCFQKRYKDLCQILRITEYQHLSKIKEKLGPSLDELKKHGYLSGWLIREGSDGSYKILLCHGARFRRHQVDGLTRRHESPTPLTGRHEGTEEKRQQRIDKDILHELMRRGISEKAALALLRNLRPDQQVMDQLEWGDHLLRSAPRGKFYNPAGVLIALIKDNVIPPESFESSRKRRLREAAEQAREEDNRKLAQIELAYMEYKDRELTSYIEKRWSVEEWAFLVEAKKREMLEQDRWKRLFSFNQDTLDHAAERQLKADIAPRVPLLTFLEFRQKLQASSSGLPIQSPLHFAPACTIS